MLYVLGAEDADNVYLQKQIEYLNKLIKEGKELETYISLKKVQKFFKYLFYLY